MWMQSSLSGRVTMIIIIIIIFTLWQFLEARQRECYSRSPCQESLEEEK